LNILTERLEIRTYTPEDLPKLHRLLSDAETMRFWPAPFTTEQSEGWLKRSLANYSQGYGRMGMFTRKGGEFVGDVGIMTLEVDDMTENDLGYIVHASHWGKGYGFEAATAVLEYGFQTLGLERICANMPTDHVASRRVAEKLGMTLEKQFLNKRNRNLPTCLYARRRAK